MSLPRPIRTQRSEKSAVSCILIDMICLFTLSWKSRGYTFGVAFLSIAVLSPYVCAAAPLGEHWAILADAELSRGGLPELLTVRLAEKAKLSLVERQQIESVARELAISNLTDPVHADKRIEMGRLLKADLLLLLRIDSSQKQPLLRVIISESHYGARLRQEVLSYDAKRLPALTDDVARLVQDTRERYPDGVQRIIGVPPFVSRNLMDDYDHLRAQLADWVGIGLAAYPGTAVLEIEEAQAIGRELSLAGGDASSRTMPIFLGGDFRVELAGEKRGTVHLALKITRDHNGESIDQSFPNIDDALKYLRHDLPARIMESDHVVESPLSIKQQVSLLASRADTFARLGEFLQSTSLREAILILDSANAIQARLLLDEYMQVSPYKTTIQWSSIEPDYAVRNFRQRLSLWKRGLEVFEGIIRGRSVDRSTAISLYRSTEQAITHLKFFAGPMWREPSPWGDSKAGFALLADLKEATHVHQAFVRDVMPLCVALPTRAKRHRPIPMDPELLDIVLRLPWYEPGPQHKLTNADLLHYQHVLDHTSGQPIFSSVIRRLLEM